MLSWHTWYTLLSNTWRVVSVCCSFINPFTGKKFKFLRLKGLPEEISSLKRLALIQGRLLTSSVCWQALPKQWEHIQCRWSKTQMSSPVYTVIYMCVLPSITFVYDIIYNVFTYILHLVLGKCGEWFYAMQTWLLIGSCVILLWCGRAFGRNQSHW